MSEEDLVVGVAVVEDLGRVLVRWLSGDEVSVVAGSTLTGEPLVVDGMRFTLSVRLWRSRESGWSVKTGTGVPDPLWMLEALGMVVGRSPALPLAVAGAVAQAVSELDKRDPRLALWAEHGACHRRVVACRRRLAAARAHPAGSEAGRAELVAAAEADLAAARRALAGALAAWVGFDGANLVPQSEGEERA